MTYIEPTPQPHPTTPEHRAQVLAALAAIWERNPNQRLGQLVANLGRLSPRQMPSTEAWLDRLWQSRDLDLINAKIEDL
jgi:hypothetical protein